MLTMATMDGEDMCVCFTVEVRSPSGGVSIVCHFLSQEPALTEDNAPSLSLRLNDLEGVPCSYWC